MDSDLRVIVYLFVGLLIGALVGALLNYGGVDGMMNMGMMGGSWMIWWILIPLVVIIFLFAITREEKNQTPRNRAVEILEEEYAKGEITKEEFEEKRRDLLK